MRDPGRLWWALPISALALACLAVGALILLGAEAGKQLVQPDPTQLHRIEPTLMVASWYGNEFAGRTTASGTIYRPSEMTAAHRHLPFGTRLLVGLKGKWIEVVVTDRGPYIKDRDLDLSEGAAEALGFRGQGLAIVRVYEIKEMNP